MTPCPCWIVAEPESYIFIIVLEIVGALAVLLVLHPLSLVHLAIREGINAITAALSLEVGTLVGIAIGVNGGIPCPVAFRSPSRPYTVRRHGWMQVPREIFCADMARGEHASIIASIMGLPVS